MTKQDVIDEIIERVDAYIDGLTGDFYEAGDLGDEDLDPVKLKNVWEKMKEYIEENQTLPASSDISLDPLKSSDSSPNTDKYANFLLDLIERLKSEMAEVVDSCFEKDSSIDSDNMLI